MKIKSSSRTSQVCVVKNGYWSWDSKIDCIPRMKRWNNLHVLHADTSSSYFNSFWMTVVKKELKLLGHATSKLCCVWRMKWWIKLIFCMLIMMQQILVSLLILQFVRYTPSVSVNLYSLFLCGLWLIFVLYRQGFFFSAHLPIKTCLVNQFLASQSCLCFAAFL